MHLLLLAVLSGGSSRVFPLCSHFKEPKQSVEFLSAESDVMGYTKNLNYVYTNLYVVYFIYYSKSVTVKL